MKSACSATQERCTSFFDAFQLDIYSRCLKCNKMKDRLYNVKLEMRLYDVEQYLLCKRNQVLVEKVGALRTKYMKQILVALDMDRSFNVGHTINLEHMRRVKDIYLNMDERGRTSFCVTFELKNKVKFEKELAGSGDGYTRDIIVLLNHAFKDWSGLYWEAVEEDRKKVSTQREHTYTLQIHYEKSKKKLKPRPDLHVFECFKDARQRLVVDDESDGID